MNGIINVYKEKGNFKKLKEKLGHEPLEVFIGMLLGTFVSFCFSLFL